MSSFERLARRVRLFLRRFPALQPLINRVGTVLWRLHLRRSVSRGGEGFELPTLVRIDPRSIERAVWRKEVLALAETDQQRNVVGLVRGGSWDEKAFPLSDLEIFEAARQHFEEGVAWPETRFFQEIEGALARGERPFKFKEPADLPRVLSKVDVLYETIVRDGYASQGELATGRSWDEVVVAIDRRGRLCFVDGRHRLAIARVLGLPEIPAIVAVRHESWVRLALEVRSYARQRGGCAYQPYVHPDLRDVPSDQGHERFELLRQALPITSGTLVDLGANSGYFSHRFEAVGFECIAVERSEKEAYFLSALRDAAGRRFRVLKGSLTEVDLPESIDVVLALNIFHHFLKTEEGHRELAAFLRRLDTRYLLFESHLPGDPQMATATHDMAPAEFVDWMLRTGGFATARSVGSAADGRPIYLLANE